MELKVGDIFVRHEYDLNSAKFEYDIILITGFSGDLVVGYWGAELRNIGYGNYIYQKVKSGSWKHYPVVK